MNVPDGWRAALLSDVCSVGPRDPALPETAPFVPMDAVKVGVREPAYYEPRGKRGGIRAKDNDLLFARITPCLENGKVSLLPPSSGPTGGSTEFLVVRPGTNVDPRYLYLWSLNPAVRERAKAEMTGTTGRMRLSGSALGALPFPHPPLPEQRRIVETVEEHMAHLDAADASLASAEQRLTYAEVALARSYFDRDTGDGSAWRWSTIGDECSVAVGATPKRSEPSLWEGDIPWVSSGDVAFTRITDTREHISERALGDRSKRLHPPGTVLLAMIGEGRTRGQAAILETWAAHNQNCASIRTAGSSIHPNFLYLFLKYKYAEVRAGGSGGNQPALNKARVRAIPIPVPPPAEQLQIAAAMEAWAEQAHRTTSAIVTQRRKSAALRRSVLAAAFSGHLTSTTDPSDLLQESSA